MKIIDFLRNLSSKERKLLNQRKEEKNAKCLRSILSQIDNSKRKGMTCTLVVGMVDKSVIKKLNGMGYEVCPEKHLTAIYWES